MLPAAMPNPKKLAKVIDLAAAKHKRLVLDAWDRREHEKTREREEKRAEVERKARNTN